jgi:hypothetical protein
MSDGVTALIAFASVGGMAGSFFSAQRCLPWLSLHSQGNSNATSGVAVAAVQRKADVRMMSVIANLTVRFILRWRLISIDKLEVD